MLCPECIFAGEEKGKTFFVKNFLEFYDEFYEYFFVRKGIRFLTRKVERFLSNVIDEFTRLRNSLNSCIRKELKEI